MRKSESESSEESNETSLFINIFESIEIGLRGVSLFQLSLHAIEGHHYCCIYCCYYKRTWDQIFGWNFLFFFNLIIASDELFDLEIGLEDYGPSHALSHEEGPEASKQLVEEVTLVVHEKLTVGDFLSCCHEIHFYSFYWTCYYRFK